MKTFKTLLLAVIALPVMADAQEIRKAVPVVPDKDNGQLNFYVYVVNPTLPDNIVELSADEIIPTKMFYQGPVTERPSIVPANWIPVVVVQFLGGEWTVLGWCWMAKSEVERLHGELLVTL